MSKRFCILLAAVISLLICCLSPATSRVIHVMLLVTNETGKDLRFCLEDKSYCETVKPGDYLEQLDYDEKMSEKDMVASLSQLRLEQCGKRVPLDQIPALRVFDKQVDWSFTTYRTKITEQDIALLCEGAAD